MRKQLCCSLRHVWQGSWNISSKICHASSVQTTLCDNAHRAAAWNASNWKSEGHKCVAVVALAVTGSCSVVFRLQHFSFAFVWLATMSTSSLTSTLNKKGFECRGTVLSQRATAWENLLRATRRSGPLSTNPLEAVVPPKSVVNKNKPASSTPLLPTPPKKKWVLHLQWKLIQFRTAESFRTLQCNKSSFCVLFFFYSKTKARRPYRTTSTLSTSVVPDVVRTSPGTSWGQVRTRSNHLDDEDEEYQKQQSSETHESKTVKLDENIQWQAFHPFEVLRGWDGSKNAAPNHSHFEWGESITRSPAHSTAHK